jgi:alkylhydroperoxidase/carboxymuconolactone decarboxylase family protein YurZ
MQHAQEMLRRLTIGESGQVAALADAEDGALGGRRLDDRTETLLRIGALVALDAPQASYQAAVGAAQRAGADLDDILAALMAVAGAVGSARVVAAAPKIALAVGYDIDSALELNDPSDHEPRRPIAQV